MQLKKNTMLARTLVAALALALTLSACGQNENADDPDAIHQPGETVESMDQMPEADEPVQPAVKITNVEPGEATERVQIRQLDDGSWYRRTSDENSNAVYEVLAADTGAIIQLSMSDTVIYEQAEGECYYEAVPIKYERDNEPVEIIQYQLHVLPSTATISVT